MPFWWRRRRKYWRGRRRPWYKRRRKTYKRKRRPRYRYRRRTYRRGRRRRKKVRKKLKKITIKQWQPDTVRKCKIKGITVNCLGGNGKQFRCYTDARFDWTPATTPGGGGFGCEIYTLNFLYKEYKRGNNKWSTSNTHLDLVRYTGCTFRFYRHSWLDFIVQYKLQYPFVFDKFTYLLCHPYEMLLDKHHKLIPSWKTYPRGPRYIKLKIKPPKQLTTTWHFQQTFADKPLLQLNTSVCDMRYSYLGCCNTNRLVTFYSLNTDIYAKCGWGNAGVWGTHGYQPYTNAPTTATKFKIQTLSGQILTGTIDASDYPKSISYEYGWFQKNLLQAAKFLKDDTHTYEQENIPIAGGRYNPELDSGSGNAIYLIDVLTLQYVKPSHDKTVIIEGIPLWKALWGFSDYVEKEKGTASFLTTALLIIESDAIIPKLTRGKYWVPVDKKFIQGQGPYGEYVDKLQKSRWYPTLQHQQETINAIVESGPFVPKIENLRDSTWELKSGYTFFLKLGGSQLPDAEAVDPSKQDTYAPPGYLSETLQISDPKKAVPSSILHAWDFRRGLVTKTAFKRMLEDQKTDSTFQTDAESPSPKKKKYSENTIQKETKESKEIKACLQKIFEESSSQESQPSSDLKLLIQQQQHKQQQLKLHLMQLLTNLKVKQQALQLHTGVLD
nr:MAG: ORF1 [Torque teno midi virus]